MNLQLGSETEARIQERMKSGRYKTPDDVLQAALQLLEKQELARSGDLADVRAKIAIGLDQLNRGEGLNGEDVFAELLAELDELRDMK